MSPILSLTNTIAAAPFRIAPERKVELECWCNDEGVEINFAKNKGFDIHVDTLNRQISVSLESIEFLWCSCYTHFLLYSEYQSELDSGNTKFDMHGSKTREEALLLFKWAANNLKDNSVNPWPAHLPKPSRFPLKDSTDFTVNEMFLAAMGWILHHELAHIRLGHVNITLSNSISEEKQADIIATKWILDRCKSSSEIKKRCIGIGSAILALMGMELPFSTYVSLTHPRAYERIYYCLEETKLDDNANLYRYIAIIMQLQLSILGIYPEINFSTHKELYYEYLNIVSRT